MAHCVITSSLPVTRCKRTYSASGRSAITTAAAWVPTLRARPSMRHRRGPTSSRTSGSASQADASCEPGAVASSSEMPSWSGTRATIWSTRGTDSPMARPTSRIAARGGERAERADLGDVRLAVLLLDVVDDLACGRSLQKSMSIWGISRRLTSRNRSKRRSYSSGQTCERWSEIGHERADARASRRRRNAHARGHGGRSPTR